MVPYARHLVGVFVAAFGVAATLRVVFRDGGSLLLLIGLLCLIGGGCLIFFKPPSQ